MIKEGSRVEWVHNDGYTMKGVVTQVYTSATGMKCIETTSGYRVPVHKCRLLNKYRD